MPSVAIDDPLFSQQWYLLNTGQDGGTPGVDLNVVPVWSDYTGQGVTVALVDLGVESAHPDLAANIDTTSSFSAFSATGNGQPVLPSDNHGMAVAGLVAAVAGNGIGGTGVAPGATLVSVYPLDPSVDPTDPAHLDDTVTAFSTALRTVASSYDAVNNSWGKSWAFYNLNDPENRNAAQALSEAVTLGRDGKGSILVFGVGNDRAKGYDANTSNLTNSPYTITVAALDNTGQVSSYSTPGASILVSAPSAGQSGLRKYGQIVTTDRMGENGYNTAPSPQGDYAYDFGGTSAAAPQVSGVVALMLEANPDLGYRDVQDILALTARNTDDSASWTINGSTTWNGGGMHVNRDVGYGLVDATAAVRLAETWDTQSTFANRVTSTGFAVADASLADGTGSAASSITLPAGISVERVGVVLNLDDSDASDLRIVLTSPSGTQSVLYDAPGMTAVYPENFSITSTHFLGESSQGTWTIAVSDTKADGSTAAFHGWTIEVSGAAATDDTRYVYTNEYGKYLAQDASRGFLFDWSGTDTLNVAAVSASSAVNLQQGTVSLVDGSPLVVMPFTIIENASGGDGNDLLVDNGAANTLSGGRGNDVIMATGGNDVINGGAGYDAVGFSRSCDAYTIGASDDTITVSSLEGVKTISNVEALSFSDRVVPTSSILAATA